MEPRGTLELRLLEATGLPRVPQAPPKVFFKIECGSDNSYTNISESFEHAKLNKIYKGFNVRQSVVLRFIAYNHVPGGPTEIARGELPVRNFPPEINEACAWEVRLHPRGFLKIAGAYRPSTPAPRVAPHPQQMPYHMRPQQQFAPVAHVPAYAPYAPYARAPNAYAPNAYAPQMAPAPVYFPRPYAQGYAPAPPAQMYPQFRPAPPQPGASQYPSMGPSGSY
eukprot:gnl/Chilomastix_cuspidata/680.p1 GENE.gnl/Chilomastix_cuspidata/680~~gnl/Chilomastix_cuspidata/680.p1  ORF type:complete len:223 (+),score=85.66 gnl/Chilomastix_cuspidata/680:54-722(+)